MNEDTTQWRIYRKRQHLKGRVLIVLTIAEEESLHMTQMKSVIELVRYDA